MSLTSNIQPVKILENTATILSTYVINYNGISCELYWWLSDSYNNKLYDGNYSVPYEVLISWQSDDSVLLQSLANNKGFIIID